MTAAQERRDDTHPDPSPTVATQWPPDLDAVAGTWMNANDLAHLPSLRNQRGQAHVNADLASLSWIASPPFAFGYHTGVLRLDGDVLPAQRYKWKPWGVRREFASPDVTVASDTRMALSRDVLLWQISVTNETQARRTFRLSQDLFAMVSHSETGWGWLYDNPWNSGNYHDFFGLERIRRTTTGEATSSDYLLGAGPRLLRLGRPRAVGIQRDDDSTPMLLEYELPQHVSEDKTGPVRLGAQGEIRGIACRLSPTDAPIFAFPDEMHLEPATEIALGSFELVAGLVLDFEFRAAPGSRDGVILTHGNHPDSLQIGVHDARLWFAIAGEREYTDVHIGAGQWHRVSVALDHSTAALSIDGVAVAHTTHWTDSRRWVGTAGALVTSSDRKSAAHAAYAFAVAPTELLSRGSGAEASWELSLTAGETRSIGIVCAFGTDLTAAVRESESVATSFPAALEATELGWRRQWSDMFTPSNETFSGHLPTLETDDPELARAYYMGALVVLYMRNLSVSATEPTYLTGGPRLGPTVTFCWDHAEWSRMYAMLDPRAMKSWLRRILSGPYRDSFGIDVRNGGLLGNDYVANDYALFRLLEHYICISGDHGFLEERAGTRTIAEHLERLAYGWKSKRTSSTGGVLADFGADPWRLLECVPNYVNVVASFNAAWVAMMRSLASLQRFRDRDEQAAATEMEARRLLDGVLDLYVEGGRWSIRHPDKTETIGHCLDFGLVAASIPDELTGKQRREMVQFVADHLIEGNWMRALSADDPIAPESDRPDHGAGGAFCAWPGLTAHGLACLGRPDLAVELLRATPGAASGGLWGQAVELVTDGEGPVVGRVAERGVSNRDSIAGAATSEAVLSGLFDFNPTFGRLGAERAVELNLHSSVPGLGMLRNLNTSMS